MKIMIIGGGVLGSLYAEKLISSGNLVTILARGKRLKEIQANGLMVEEHGTGKVSRVGVRVVEKLAPEEKFDFAIVLVRKNQLEPLLPILADTTSISTILFMVNNPSGFTSIIEAIGKERILIGFPGAGGEKDGALVRAKILPGWFQPTTLGELDGEKTERLKKVAKVLNAAGFPVAIEPNMDAWLKTHVAVVGPIANGIYMAGGSNYSLAHSREGLALVTKAIQEGLAGLRALGVPIRPSRYRLLCYFPVSLIVIFLRMILNTRFSELVMTRHANSARDEMSVLSAEFKAAIAQANIQTPSIDRLNRFNDSTSVA